MDLPRDLLRTLVAAVDEGTLDGAAHALAVTPSAVSQRVRQLEARVGRVVLTRSKPVRPTPDGEVLLRLGREMALLEHEALQDLGEASGAMRVSLGVNADSLGTWFLPAIAEVSLERGIVVELHREDQERTATLLETGVVMGAVTSQREPVAGCVSTPLGRMRYEAVASRAFAQRWLPDGPDAAALALAPVVDFDRDDVLQRRYLDARGVRAHPPRHIVSASAEFATAVELGMGWGMLLPHQIAQADAREPLVRLGAPTIDVPLYWQRWNLASPVLDAVSDAVAAAAKAAHAA